MNNKQLMTLVCSFWMGAGVAVVGKAAVPPAFEGTWTLDVAKSRFGSDKPFQSEVLVVAPTQSGSTHNKLDWVEADGTKVHLEYDTAYDGKKAPITGMTGVDGIKASFPDPSNLALVLYDGDKRVQWGHLKLSADGKTLEGPLNGVDPDGSKWHYHYVWRHE